MLKRVAKLKVQHLAVVLTGIYFMLLLTLRDKKVKTEKDILPSKRRTQILGASAKLQIVTIKFAMSVSVCLPAKDPVRPRKTTRLPLEGFS
jgi:hypothetical protein